MLAVVFHFLGSCVLGSHLGWEVGFALFHCEGGTSGSGGSLLGRRGVIDFTTDEVGGSLGDDCVAVDAVSEEGCQEGAGSGTNHCGL